MTIRSARGKSNRLIPHKPVCSDRRRIQLRVKKRESANEELKGWKSIAEFLSQPVSVVQRWAKSGMPLQRRGRYVTASPEELRAWLGKESGISAPVHISSDQELGTDLKQSLKLAKRK